MDKIQDYLSQIDGSKNNKGNVTHIPTRSFGFQILGFGSGGAVDEYITATGGTITTDGDFKIHVFTSDATFAVTAGGGPKATVDYFVVAGGGGAGSGGGGAGGFRLSNEYAQPGPTMSPVSNPTGVIISAGDMIRLHLQAAETLEQEHLQELEVMVVAVAVRLEKTDHTQVEVVTLLLFLPHKVIMVVTVAVELDKLIMVAVAAVALELMELQAELHLDHLGLEDLEEQDLLLQMDL